VRAYLDHREINGYTPQQVSVYGRAAPDAEQDSVLMRDVLVYVGLPDNEAFVGPAPSQTHLAARIFSCAGPSGRNDEYVLRLARATRALAPQVTDRHLFDLEERLLALRRAEGLPELGEDVVDADREQRILEEVLQRAASRPP
jgi:DnaJ family protein A protein 5